MPNTRLQEMSDHELEALTSEELLAALNPSLAGGFRDVWSRTERLPGNWADELVSDRREQVSTDRAHAK